MAKPVNETRLLLQHTLQEALRRAKVKLQMAHASIFLRDQSTYQFDVLKKELQQTYMKLLACCDD
jgi:hypothetical protein